MLPKVPSAIFLEVGKKSYFKLLPKPNGDVERSQEAYVIIQASVMADDEYIVAAVGLARLGIRIPAIEVRRKEALRDSGTKMLCPGEDAVVESVKRPG